MKTKARTNSNDNNFLRGCPNESHTISRCLKLKTYKHVANANHNNFKLRYPIESRNIWRRFKLKKEALSKFKGQ